MENIQFLKISYFMGLCCPSNIQSNYKALESSISPLDVIAFNGGDFISDAITTIETYMQDAKEKWSHVGLVVNSDILTIPNAIPKRLYIIESTFSYLPNDTKDIENNKSKFGVQIRDLEHTIASYKTENTKIALCKLKNNPICKDTINKIKNDFNSFKERNGSAKYNWNPIALASTFCGCCANLDKSGDGTGKYFCSQLVADIYKTLGIFPDTVNPVKISPAELLYLTRNPDCPNVLEKPILF